MIIRGISKGLVTRCMEIYSETSNVGSVNGKTPERFWATKGVRQGYPLSPTLFAIFLADIEEHFKNGQEGGLIVGQCTFWTLAYADNLVLLAKS